MGGSSSPSLPKPPKFKEDPRFSSGMDQLFGLGGQLTSGDFTGGLSHLQGLTTVDPAQLQALFAGLSPYFRDTKRETINQLANLNQVESSVAGNRLMQHQTDLENALIAGTLPLINQSRENAMRLFGSGLNTLSGATGFAGQREGKRNEFSLRNYENQMAYAIAKQGDQSGGLWGGLTGALGGIVAGAPLGPLGMIGGGLLGGGAGYFGPSGTGGQILSAGSSLYGGLGSGGTTSGAPTIFNPRSGSASNDPFGLRSVGTLKTNDPFIMNRYR